MDWRETTAQTNDVPPYVVCSEFHVLKMSELKPISLFHLDKIIRNQSPYVKYQIRTLISIIKNSIPRTPDHTSAKKIKLAPLPSTQQTKPVKYIPQLMDLIIPSPPQPTTPRTVEMIDLDPEIKTMIEQHLEKTTVPVASESVASNWQDSGDFDEDILEICVEEEELDDLMLFPSPTLPLENFRVQLQNPEIEPETNAPAPPTSNQTTSEPATQELLSELLEAVQSLELAEQKEAMKNYCFICWDRGHKRGKCTKPKNTEEFRQQKASRLQALKVKYPQYFEHEKKQLALKKAARRPKRQQDPSPQ
jgi:hypothetical protein